MLLTTHAPAGTEQAMAPPLPTAAARRVVLYARCSTVGQAEDGVSLDVQVSRCRAYAVAHDLDVVAVHSDALSGKDANRPGLRAALALLDAGEADGLLVLKLDRLTRSVRDLGDLLASHFGERFALLSVGEHVDTRTASGRLMLNLLMSVASWEREVIGERTKAALALLKANGKKLGGDRGHDAPGTRARAVALKASGLSLRGVAAAMSAEGLATRSGSTKWSAEGVRLLLARAARSA